MNIVRVIICVALVGTAFTCRAESWTGSAVVSFTGSSTLHDFHGHGEAEPFEATVVDAGTSGAARVSCRAELKVGNLDTGNKSRDKSMYSMFKIAEFPLLEGSLTEVESGAAEVPLTISILGQEQTVLAKSSDWKSTADAQSFTLSFDVSLAKSGLKPPRAAAGLIRVADRIAVTVRAELARPSQ